MNSKNNLLDTIKSYWWVIVLMLLPFIVYLLAFHDRPISHDTNVWGAFGNYYGGIIGIIPVLLLYITYREQRHANQIMLFNQRHDALFRNIGDYINAIPIAPAMGIAFVCIKIFLQPSDL